MKKYPLPSTLKKPLAGLLLSIVIAVGPLLLVWTVDLIADLNGCDLNESGAESCLIAGLDIGGLLYSLFMSGWYLFITFPIGAVLFLGSLIWIAMIIKQMIYHG